MKPIVIKNLHSKKPPVNPSGQGEKILIQNEVDPTLFEQPSQLHSQVKATNLMSGFDPSRPKELVYSD